MNILLVDDDCHRCKELVQFLVDNGIEESSIQCAHRTQDAKKLLRNTTFDFLVLDVVLPKRQPPALAKHGLELLSEIKRRNTLKTPRKIVGITAKIDDIDVFRDEFNEYFEVVIEASNKDSSWKSKILNEIEFEEKKKISLNLGDKNITCLSVHGIRTRGAWHQELKSKLDLGFNSIKFENYKYGYFALFSFLIPFFRLLPIYRFKKALEKISNESSELHIFCHSFGTYIVVHAINDLLRKGVNLNISQLVLCGSVLRSSHDFSLILEKTNARIVNDCGSNDIVLLFSEAFVPNTGMAGRVGFYGRNNDRFTNRYFKGGHSHYFEKDCGFIEKYWISLFHEGSVLELVDFRKDSVIRSELIEKFCSTAGKVKEVFYILGICYFSFYH